jgi:hypothetical protein
MAVVLRGSEAPGPLARAVVVGRDGIEPPTLRFFSRVRHIQIRPAWFA